VYNNPWFGIQPPMTLPPSTYPWYPQVPKRCHCCCCGCCRPVQPPYTFSATVSFIPDEEASSDDE
jgi:hypothetical protein